MLLSVIISTCNRAERLSQLFSVMGHLQIVHGMDWELLVVDNGSHDDTWHCIQEEHKRYRLPLICLQQPIPGKSNALNLAMTMYRGDLAIFTDDDLEPSPTWLIAYYEAALDHPDMLGFTGRVLPLWEGPQPEWVQTAAAIGMLKGIINSRDFGDSELVLPPSEIPGGGNTALRRNALNRMGTFCIHLGPGTSVPYAEDTEFLRRLLRIGGYFLYVPRALVRHRNPPSRMTPDYAARWTYQVGRCQVIAFKASPSYSKFLGIPIYLWRQAAQRLLFWLFELRPHLRFQKRLKLMLTLGEIRGYRSPPISSVIR
jgi:glycosyltransferase involved in cell wall biosynthesis